MAQKPFYHFLLIAPDLGAEWLFNGAREYWDRFRPVVISNFEFPRLITQDATIIITAIARRDTIAQYGVQVAQAVPQATFDPVSYDRLEQLQSALKIRIDNNQPYGAQIVAPVGEAIQPTPGSIIGGAVSTRAPSGFITQTPTPNQADTQPQPNTTPEPPEHFNAAITPTPGSIIGGG